MQTTINRNGQPRAIAGLIADLFPMGLASAFSGESSSLIQFGFGVVNAGVERQAKIPSGGSDIFMGIAAFSLNHQPDTGGFDLVSGASGGIKPKGAFEVVRSGHVWVLVDKAVTSITPYSDRGFLRYTADGTTNPTPGAWGKATDSGKNLDLTKVVQFISPLVTAADGTTKIAMVEIMAVNKP